MTKSQAEALKKGVMEEVVSSPPALQDISRFFPSAGRVVVTVLSVVGCKVCRTVDKVSLDLVVVVVNLLEYVVVFDGRAVVDRTVLIVIGIHALVGVVNCVSVSVGCRVLGEVVSGTVLSVNAVRVLGRVLRSLLVEAASVTEERDVVSDMDVVCVNHGRLVLGEVVSARRGTSLSVIVVRLVGRVLRGLLVEIVSVIWVWVVIGRVDCVSVSVERRVLGEVVKGTVLSVTVVRLAGRVLRGLLVIVVSVTGLPAVVSEVVCVCVDRGRLVLGDVVSGIILSTVGELVLIILVSPVVCTTEEGSAIVVDSVVAVLRLVGCVL